MCVCLSVNIGIAGAERSKCLGALTIAKAKDQTDTYPLPAARKRVKTNWVALQHVARNIPAKREKRWDTM